MSVNSLDELIIALSLIEEPVVEAIEYRIHYDDGGNITMCTMQQHPENSQYLVVSQHEYDNYFRYYVVDNQLKKIDIPMGDRVQLKKSNTGYQVVKNHAGLILEPD
jgi:hypothetical protein